MTDRIRRNPQTTGRRVAIVAGAVALLVLALAAYLGWPHLVF